MTDLTFTTTKRINGKPSFKVDRTSDRNGYVGRIEYRNGRGWTFSARGYMPEFSPDELRGIAAFIDSQERGTAV